MRNVKQRLCGIKVPQQATEERIMPREEQARREMLEEREQVVVVVEVVGLVGRGVVEVGFEEGGELVGVGGGGEGYAMREVILNFGRH